MKYKSILSIKASFWGCLAGAFLMSSCGLFKNYERPADINTDGIYGDAQSGNEQG